MQNPFYTYKATLLYSTFIIDVCLSNALQNEELLYKVRFLHDRLYINYHWNICYKLQTHTVLQWITGSVGSKRGREIKAGSFLAKMRHSSKKNKQKEKGSIGYKKLYIVLVYTAYTLTDLLDSYRGFFFFFVLASLNFYMWLISLPVVVGVS